MNVVLPMDAGNISAVPALPTVSDLRGRPLPGPTSPGVIRALFDRGFYLARYPDVAASGLDALEHFLSRGMAEGRSPHPLFDAEFYAARMPPDCALEPAFQHYLRSGALEQIDPHPLFDTSYYITQTEQQTLYGQLPLLHLLTSGTRAQLSPNPLFDAAYYRRTNHIDGAHPRHPLLHYIETGWREGCRTHPLFDAAYYLRQRPDIALAGIDPLAHFLRQGRHETASTHELFDAAHYRAGYAGRQPELDAIEALGGILHYVLSLKRQPPSPHPLFQREFYAERHVCQLQEHLQGENAQRDPFLHFIEFGLCERHDPHPLFDSAFYARRYPDITSQDVNPFLHFVRHGAGEGRDPNSFLDCAGYLLRHPEALACGYGAISHYMASDTRLTEAASARFDPAYYADCLDAAGHACGPDPLAHYLASGRPGGYAPLPHPLAGLAWHGNWSLNRGTHARPVLLISPDATRQPASLCALRAIQHLASDQGLACNVALLQGGALETEFASAAPTLMLRERRDIVELLYAFQKAAPDGIVIVNTAAMPEVVALAGRLRLKLLAWLHEMPVSIDSLLGGDVTMRALAAGATRIVTVSHHAHAALSERYGLADDQLVVLGNGIDRPAGHPDGHLPHPDDARNTATTIREELGMSPDALLVLGGGPIDFRHGTDLFIKVAQQVLLQSAATPGSECALARAHFIWIGDETDRLFSGLCRHDVQQLGLSGQVRLVSTPSLMQRLRVGADIFLMTSRAEAFDGDGMQADRNGLSVVAFAGCVSQSDLRPGSMVLMVPYLDVTAMAAAVMKLGNPPARRNRGSGHGHSHAAGSSWNDWHAGLRLILEQDFGVPPRSPG